MSGALSPADRERLDVLFDLAAELSQAEQAAFIEEECGPNHALRDELVGLLAGLSGEDILGRMQTGTPSRAGTQIGRYKVLERIGQGGMGEVYAAQQLEPVVRRVALKIIKPGMDSREILARFEAERQALARMAHPNIAQVYDGGTTSEGRPYFVMEYVAGEPVTEFCDRRKLATRERLELFLEICAGVQHAHQKGVVHRDLKPSNLMVTQQDGRAVPKIIDFGVARATTGQLTERTLHTLIGQIVGTLDYMSPEQADPTGVDIDTRSDIYSLGVVLYQLVSGLLPFDHGLATGVPLSEVQRAIRENNPPTPSTRLRRQTGTATTIAPLHGTDESSLVRQLAGDLDWICLKALEKDPDRRYQSASELAEDLRRHLKHEPVLARRPGALYIARKFVRRHRVAVTAGVLVAAATVAGIVGTVSGRLEAAKQAIETEVQRERAKASELQRLAEAVGKKRLSDARSLRDLVAEADELWPAHPAKIPALESWMSRARLLMESLPGHRDALVEMRVRAQPWSEADQTLDRTAWDGELESKKFGVENLIAQREERPLKGPTELRVKTPAELDAAAAPLEEVIAHEVREVGRLEAQVDVRRTWRYDTLEEESQYEALSELVASLQSFEADLLAESVNTKEHGWSVPRRIEYARKLQAGFADGGEHAEKWADALPRIRAAYPGLDLKVQMGLVPLGPDPDSHLWEFAHLQSGEPAARGPDGKWLISEKTGLVLVLIPGGAFYMGAQSKDESARNYEPMALNNEFPVHEQIVGAFFLSKFEMTQAQWLRFVGTVPSAYGWYPRDPVNFVSWNECTTATRRLGLALPHEIEWEYAARAGTTTSWWAGNEVAALEGKDNFLDLTKPKGFLRQNFLREGIEPVPWKDGYAVTAPVGTFAANPFGLHEVLGNVNEVCSRTAGFYGGRNPPQQAAFLAAIMARGGSCEHAAEAGRSAIRLFLGTPDYKSPHTGLRPARALDT